MQLAEIKTFVKRNKGLVIMGSIAAICLMSFGAFALLPNHPAVNTAPEPVRVAAVETDQNAQPPRLLDSGAPFSFAPLVERVSPAVVSVTAEERVAAPEQTALPQNIPEPFRQFFRNFGQGAPAAPRKRESMGSGFIIDKSGLIVTNNHVVGGATKIKVKLSDGRSFDAKLIGTDTATDVALIKVHSDKPLPTVEFGNDRSLRVGDWVIAVGNPFGLSNTVTAGIVSSIGRDINSAQPYTDFIQIDAPINQGNSGGPTFDLRGQVVGMNSMIYSPTGGNVGIGFAIPSSTVREVVEQLETHGKVARGWLGVQINSITPDIAASLGLKDPKGAIVTVVVEGSPAAKAGFVQGDVIVSLNKKPIDDYHDLQRRVAALKVGETAYFGVVREGEYKTLKAVIALRKDEEIANAAPVAPGVPGAVATGKAVGLSLSALTDETRRAFGIEDNVHGAVVTKVDPDSDAAEKGVSPGDVVVSVSNHPVSTPQEVEKRVAEARAAGRSSVLLLVSSHGINHYVAVETGKK